MTFLAVTETHLDSKISNKQIAVDNYKIFRSDRSTGAGGGGCLIYLGNHVCCSRLNCLEDSDVEGLWVKITANSSVFVFGTFYYRPPSDNMSLEHFSQMLEKVWMKYKSVVLVGDFNCDMSGDRELLSINGRKLTSMLDPLEYIVVNNCPTRVTNDTATVIDLVITSKSELNKQGH